VKYSLEALGSALMVSDPLFQLAEILLNVARQVLQTNGSACQGNLIVSSPKAFIAVAYDGCSWVIDLWNRGLKVGEKETPGVLVFTLNHSPSEQNVVVLSIGGDRK
jgi:hypothetical protein